jgi:adenosylcobinamide-phosphate synthase
MISLAVMLLALLIDLIFGDPSNRFHPVAWMGRLATLLKPHLRAKNSKLEKINGTLLAVFVVCVFSIPVYVVLLLIQQHLPLVVYVIVAAIFLKLTFAIKGMERASLKVTTALKRGNVREARRHLSCIVRRDTSKLNQELMLSATVESIGESTVDGITSAFFYFALFGVPGAVAFRVVNTLDSVVGYMDPKHINIGWFSAKFDSVLNFIPARLTAGLMVIAASLLGESRRNSWRILKRDKNKTASVNAGWPMSAMAGALRINLKKLGHYSLGDNEEKICHGHVVRALRIMGAATFLFLALIVVPVCLVKTLGVS